jgi:RNA polymerase sigma-70 factor (ECF subfamily)
VRDLTENNQISLERPLFADEAEFETAFREYYTTLYRVVFRVLKKEDASEDVVQDLFVKLWNKREGLRISGSLKAYLCQAAVNAAYDHLRKYKKEQNKEEVDVLWERGGNQTEEYIQGKEMEEMISEALEKLPPACRNVFILSREEEMSYKEIAEALNISVKTVENQMGKALKILREELQPHLENLIKVIIFIFISISA